MTPAPSLVELFVAPLNRTGIEYMVTGGLAAVVYGHPRLTLDVDLVIRMSRSGARTLVSLWPAEQFYVPPVAVIEEEQARTEHGHCNIIHQDTMMRADVYFAGSDELAAWALGRRVVREIQGERVQFAPIEYVIVNKLRYFREGGSDRHLRDIARMIDVSGADIDRSALDQWIVQLRLGDAWAKARDFRERD